MAYETLQRCDICSTPLVKEWHEGLAKRHECYGKKNGVSIEVKHSPGGWGYSKELINFTGEVCQRCYAELGKRLESVQEFIAAKGKP